MNYQGLKRQAFRPFSASRNGVLDLTDRTCDNLVIQAGSRSEISPRLLDPFSGRKENPLGFLQVHRALPMTDHHWTSQNPNQQSIKSNLLYLIATVSFWASIN